jgi:carbamoyltransferase
MGVTLGIHVGHDASCAVAREGELLAAVQQERVSRRKHDGEESLCNRLPVEACLAAAGLTLRDVDHIVTSFQAASPGGCGLHRPLVERDFNLFDPWDRRHFVLSHHLAHGYSAFGTSGFEGCAVLVCDLGGSSTLDGRDFCLPFAEWHRQVEGMPEGCTVRTECRTVYKAAGSDLVVRHKEYCVPHNAPESYVQNAASLYDNVARCVFGREDAHGQLMALAALGGDPADHPLDWTDLVGVDGDDRVSFRNDWQLRVTWGLPVEHQAPLARACQEALEWVLLAHAREALRICGADRLAAAGGVFLNILANTRIAAAVGHYNFYVPSAPHDAGVAVGCALYGERVLGRKECARVAFPSDRLGREYDTRACLAAADARADVLTRAAAEADEVASLLAGGAIVARFAGRAEFGPRALGGRSLLGSPLAPETKARLNAIKGRQAWRSVAPVVLKDRFGEIFDGPAKSHYMLFAHRVRPPHSGRLPVLHHPDGTTRAQTLDPAEDPGLAEVLVAFERLTGFAVLANTSLNGPGEPMVETPEEAVDYYLRNPGVDYLWLAGWLVARRPPWSGERLARAAISLHPSTVVSRAVVGRTRRTFLTRGARTAEVDPRLVPALGSLEGPAPVERVLEELGGGEGPGSPRDELYRLLLSGFVEVVGPDAERGGR